MKLLLPLVLSIFVGCASIPEQVKTETSRNADRCDRFIILMNSGVTSRADEREFIKANAKAWHAQDFGINGKPMPPEYAPVGSSN